jgi:protein gp37
MRDTGIQWADDTVNPTSGCDGCELWTPGVGGPCYAGNLHEQRLAKSLPLLYAASFSEVRLVPGRMAKVARARDLTGQQRKGKPWLDNLRRKIFVEDLGDVFSAAVPFAYLRAEVIDVASSSAGARHDWLLLTKQPGRAAQFAAWLAAQGLTWPANVWLGTSITGRAKVGRVKHLAEVPARHRFLSLEPLREDPGLSPDQIRGVVDWLIVGGESDQGAHRGREFKVEWCRVLLALAREVGVAPFVKQLGSHPTLAGQPLHLPDKHGGEWGAWPEGLGVRAFPPEPPPPPSWADLLRQAPAGPTQGRAQARGSPPAHP